MPEATAIPSLLDTLVAQQRQQRPDDIQQPSLLDQLVAQHREEARLAKPTWGDMAMGELKGLSKGLTAGWVDFNPTPNEQTSMGTGDFVGSTVANLAPYLAGPGVGLAANAAYAGAREAEREHEQGKGYSIPGIAAQTVLGGAMSKIPMGAASLGKRLVTGAVTGALGAGATQGVQQLTDTGTLDPSTLVPNLARGAGVGAIVNGAMGHPLAGSQSSPSGKAVKYLQETFAPQTISPAAAKVADFQRQMGARTDAATGALQRETKQIRGTFNTLTPDQRKDFMYNIDEGGPRPADPFLASAYDFFTQKLNQQKQELQSRGGLQSALQDYFPRIYKDPSKASTWAQSKATLQGPQGNMRQRTIPTLREAIDPNQGGLELASDNPADLFLQRMQAGERWKGATDLRSFMDALGVRQFAKGTASTPQGWLPEPGTQPTTYVNGAKERVLAGQHVVSPDIEPLLSNITGKSAFNNPVASLAREGSGLLNQAQLGIPGFHAGATVLNSYASKLPEVLQHLKNGEYGLASKALVESPFAPIVDAIRGHTLREDVLNGVHNTATDQLEKAGGRVTYQDAFKTDYGKAFTDAIAQKNVGNALKTGLPAMLEFAAAPVMRGLVPRLKLGAFSNLARGIDMTKLSSQEQRAVLGEIWDSVENRFGQLTHDNLFWNKTARDLGGVLMRSPGWNIGTVREIGGGLMDLAKGNLSNRAGYTATLPLTVGALGGVYHYLHTGQAPQTAQDYFYPKTGAENVDGTEERMLPPSYLTKDISSFAEHPTTTVMNKVNPGLELMNELFAKNKDFSGTQIYNPHDDGAQQAAQIAKYLGVQATPFVARNVLKLGEGNQLGRQGAGIMPKVEQLFGLNAAPLRMSRSNAQNLAMEYLGNQTPQVRTPDETAVSQAKRTVRMAVGRPNQDQIISDAFDNGLIRPDDVGKLVKQSGQPFFPGAIQRLPPQQVLDIFEKGTPEERMQMAPLMAKQLRLLAKQPPMLRDQLLPRFMTALQSLAQSR